MVYILNCTNTAVTKFYLDVIGKMFEANGQKYVFIDKKYCGSINKRDICVVSTALDFIYMYTRGIRNLILWIQGVEPEESFLKHHGYIRMNILNLFLHFSIKNALGIIYVSKEMQNFLEKKYRVSTSEKAFVMPCFNDNIKEEIFLTDGKYDKNVFCYAGSLSKWQYFEETIDFYRRIECEIQDAELKVFTSEQEEAKEVLSAKKIESYSVQYVKPEQLSEALSKVKFGFVLREDIIVNQVATPTKLSSYLAAGVIPIFSTCLCDFYEQAKKMYFAVPVEEELSIPEKLMELCKKPLNGEKVLEEYRNVFSSYYSVSHYIENAKPWIYRIIAESMKNICN